MLGGMNCAMRRSQKKDSWPMEAEVSSWWGTVKLLAREARLFSLALYDFSSLCTAHSSFHRCSFLQSAVKGVT